MSHELRTPLNSILAISRLLAQHSDGGLSSEQEKQVGFVLKAAEDLTELVDDLLDLAKAEAGKVLVRPTDFELGRLFGALRGTLRPLLVGDAVRLVFDEPGGLPEIYGDEGKVSQILRNFLSNALKFTERGEIRVGATLVPRSRIQISVSDTGIGIAVQDQAGIFEEFGQVEHAMQTRFKGTGLGLALSRRLAEILGGAISVESKLGEGSTFTLELPLRYEERPQAPPTPAVESPEHLAAPGERTLLVVDDDAAARYVVRDLAGRLGFAVVEAGDGQAGLRAAERRPTAVVLDLVMSGLGGEEVLRQLRAQPATAALPVVVATSKVLERTEKEGLERLSAIVLPKSALGSSDAVRHLADALQRAGCSGTLVPLPSPSPEPVS
jgi:CheY-like chemotaxis protein